MFSASAIEEEENLLMQDIANQKIINFDIREEMKLMRKGMKICKERLIAMEKSTELLMFEMKKQEDDQYEQEKRLKKGILKAKIEAGGLENLQLR